MVDHSLLSREEIERRGRVVIDPCLVCRHNRSAHIVEGSFVYEIRGERFDRDVWDACIACTCLEFVVLHEDEEVSIPCPHCPDTAVSQTQLDAHVRLRHPSPDG